MRGKTRRVILASLAAALAATGIAASIALAGPSTTCTIDPDTGHCPPYTTTVPTTPTTTTTTTSGGGGTTTDIPTLVSKSAVVTTVEEYYSLTTAGLTKCTKQKVEQTIEQLWAYDVLKWELWFRVCYSPNVKIVSFNRSDPQLNPNPQARMTLQRLPWNYCGVASGYPQVSWNADQLYIDMRVSMCFVPKAATKYPYIQVTFFKNGTRVVSHGVK